MKKLSTKERVGAAALAAVSLGFVASAFILRGCCGDVAVSSVDSVQDPVAVYFSDSISGEYEDDDDIREGKKRKKRKTAKRQKKNKSRKRHDDRGNKADSASFRDFLKEPVPVKNRPDR